MKKANFFTPAPNGLTINFDVAPTWKTNSVGTNFLLLEVNGEIAGVHEDSVPLLQEEATEEGLLPSDWAVSKSKILYKRQKRGSTSPWEF